MEQSEEKAGWFLPTRRPPGYTHQCDKDGNGCFDPQRCKVEGCIKTRAKASAAVWKGQNLVVKKRGGGERVIPWDKWYGAGSRAMGSEKQRMERKLHNGYKPIYESDIIKTEDVWQKET